MTLSFTTTFLRARFSVAGMARMAVPATGSCPAGADAPQRSTGTGNAEILVGSRNFTATRTDPGRAISHNGSGGLAIEFDGSDGLQADGTATLSGIDGIPLGGDLGAEVNTTEAKNQVGGASYALNLSGDLGAEVNTIGAKNQVGGASYALDLPVAPLHGGKHVSVGLPGLQFSGDVT